MAKYYEGVIELCATCASKKDPNNAGEHFYSKGEPLEDQEGYAAYIDRRGYYDEIKQMLDHIYQSESATASENNAISNDALHVIELAFQTRDQLLHMAIYEWMLANGLRTELLNITESTLGQFLSHSMTKSPHDLQLADILWKYHERNGDHAEATRILDELASIENVRVPLAQRIEYLARAVMCLRSDAVGYSASNGVLLRNLENKLEIARVQKIIQDTLPEDMHGDACERLNDRLYNMSELYANFAEVYQLSECKLTIVNYSHHNDPLLIESIWMEIIDDVLNVPAAPPKQMQDLLAKVHQLSTEYSAGGHCFPLAFLVRELELRCCRLQLDESPVPDAFVHLMQIDFDLLLDIYSRLISINERVWANEGNEWHLVHSAAQLVVILVEESHTVVAPRNRRRVVSKANDLLSACRNLLYPKPDTHALINALDALETKLQRI